MRRVVVHGAAGIIEDRYQFAASSEIILHQRTSICVMSDDFRLGMQGLTHRQVGENPMSPKFQHLVEQNKIAVEKEENGGAVELFRPKYLHLDAEGYQVFVHYDDCEKRQLIRVSNQDSEGNREAH